MRIDVHSHVVPPTVIAALEREPERFGTRIVDRDGRRFFDVHGREAELDPEFHDTDAKVAWMDRNRIDVSVLSVGPPVFFYWLPPDAGLALARLANDGIAQMVAKHPARLRGMAHLPMQHPDAAIAEPERSVVSATDTRCATSRRRTTRRRRASCSRASTSTPSPTTRRPRATSSTRWARRAALDAHVHAIAIDGARAIRKAALRRIRVRSRPVRCGPRAPSAAGMRPSSDHGRIHSASPRPVPGRPPRGCR